MSASKGVINAVAIGSLWLAELASGTAGSEPSSHARAGRVVTGRGDNPPFRGAQPLPDRTPSQSAGCACELSLRIEDKWDGSGASIPVRVTIRNKGPEVIYWFRNRLDNNSLWTVKNAAGRLIDPANPGPRTGQCWW